MQQLIERDHTNSHYRRLNGATSSFQINRTGREGCASSRTGRRLCTSVSDLNLDERLRRLERKMMEADQSAISQSIASKSAGKFAGEGDANSKKRAQESTFESSLDVMEKNAKYFSQPAPFTPRVLRKIVQPSGTGPAPSSPMREHTRRRDRQQHSAPVTASSSSRSDDTAKLSRVPSDDSAFGEGANSPIASSRTNGSPLRTDAFDYKKWAAEQ